MSFLKFTGKNEKENNYYVFGMDGYKRKTKYPEVIQIPSPITDNNFKQVFGKHEEIARSLLNSLLYPNSNDIIKVEYLPSELPGKIDEYPEEAKLYSLDSLRFDVLCKCKLNDDKKEEEQIQGEDDDENDQIKEEDKDEMIDESDEYENYAKEIQKIVDSEKDDQMEKTGKKNKKLKNKRKKDNEKRIIVDLEMQIGYDIESTRKFIDYAKGLNLKYGGQIIVLSLAYRGSQQPKKNKGFEISLQKTDFSDYKKVEKYGDYIIYQIDLDYCRKLISETKENLWIINEKQIMNDSSKEWIKYLTLPLWCKSSKPYYYEFPPIEQKFFKTDSIYEAFLILSGQNELDYLSHAKYQESQEKKIIAFLKLFRENKEKDKKLKEKDAAIKEKDEKIKELLLQINQYKNGNSNIPSSFKYPKK